MLSRDWRRLRHTYSWQPVGAMAILLLLATLVLDALWTDYTQVTQRLDAAEAELVVTRMQVKRLPALEAMATQIAAEYGGIQARLIPAQDGVAAGEEFGQILIRWYASKGITQTSIREVQRRQEGDLIYYRANLVATLKLEQLIDLLENIAFAPVSVRVVEAVISGNNGNTPDGLRTMIGWEGLLVSAKEHKINITKPVDGSRKKSGETSGRTAIESPTTLKVNEEKSK